MAFHYRLPFLITLVFFASGCAVVSRPYPEKRYYALETERPGAPEKSARTDTILVNRFRISPAFASKYLVYRNDADHYVTDFYNEFLVPPQDMVTDQTIRWLGRSPAFGHVVSAASRTLPDFILEAAITSIYGDYRDENRPVAVLEIQFFILDAVQPGSPIVFQKNYLQREALTDTTPATLVRAWNGALGVILGRLERELGQFRAHRS